MQVEIVNEVGSGSKGEITWEIRTSGIVLVHIPQHSHESFVFILAPWADRIEGTFFEVLTQD